MGINHLNRNKEGVSAFHRKSIVQRIIVIAVVFCMVINNPVMMRQSRADSTSQVNVTVDYAEEMAMVTAGSGGSTKFYLSTDGKKSWDLLDTTAVDLSGLLTTREYIIYFKGNKDSVPTAVTLQGEDRTLKPVYSIANGVGLITFTSPYTVQYKKGDNGSWKTVTSPFYTSIYELKGAKLYFRTAPSTTKRAGKIVTVNVRKRPSAPSVRLDGSKLCITGLSSGKTQYRIGDSTVWNTFTATTTTAKVLDLATLLGVTVSNSPIPASIIEFRTSGADKRLPSSVKVLEIPLQTTMSASFASINGTTLTILDSNTRKQYEYTVVSRGSFLNLNTARWSTINGGRTVKISRVGIGDKILVRIKSTVDTTTKQVIPASTYIEYLVTSISL